MWRVNTLLGQRVCSTVLQVLDMSHEVSHAANAAERTAT